MQTYLILNLVVIVAIIAWVVLARVRLTRQALLGGLAVLLVCTAIFDSWIVESGIVLYHDRHILGVYIGSAPIEDFAYAVAAAILMPALWRYLKQKDTNGKA
jgi:lycopene cyclase domain-containing protein